MPSRRSAPSGCFAGRSGRSSSPSVPIASTSAASLAVDEVRAVRAGIKDRAIFADEIRRDRFRDTPGDQLLTGLRGKDVIVAFVESYGKVAVQDSVCLAARRCGSRRGDGATGAPPASTRGAPSSPRPRSAAPAGSRTPLCIRGSGSTGNGATTSSSRATGSRSARRSSGPDGAPSTTCRRTTGTGRSGSFYGYDKVYDQRNLGYLGPTFAYRSHARPVRPPGSATPRARETRPPSRSSRRSTWCRAMRRGPASPS